MLKEKTLLVKLYLVTLWVHRKNSVLILKSKQPVKFWKLPVIIINWRFFLDDLTPGTRTSHGWTQENVDQQHDTKQNAKSNAKPLQPIRVAGTETRTEDCRSRLSWSGLGHKHRSGRGHSIIFAPFKNVDFSFDGRQLAFILELGFFVFCAFERRTSSQANGDIALEVSTVWVG